MKKEQNKPDTTTRRFEEALVESDSRRFVFRLFVAGLSPRSQEAIGNVHSLCEEYLKDRYELKIIDIYQHPLSARENQIIAAPTLVRKLPLPLRKFVGDMSKTAKILAGLDFRIEENV
ncbi:MAG: circadian clock KaiB family protein [Chitinivibrionales bacterium]|nr:circadian clock KaiB family protein [Chitinivibrionales bacterium]